MSSSVPAAVRLDAPARRPPWELVLLGATVVSLVLIPIRIHRAFGLPAHPLLLHVPVVVVPVAGLAALVLLARPAWLARYGAALGVLSVVATAATILTVGAGQAFRADRSGFGGGPGGEESSRLAVRARADRDDLPAPVSRLLSAPPLGAALRVAAAGLAIASIFFVIRTGHLGAQLTWEQPEGGGPPAFNQQPGG
jgi:uncharacterized membrane protein